jgi:c-di-GMP-binding flagellar brake protein YcgR
MEQRQRRHPRLPFAVLVQIETDTHAISGMTHDISTTGLYLQSKEELAPDTPCNFSIVLHSGTAESTIRGLGRVVRLDLPKGSERGVGIHFEDMDPQSQSLLWRVIQYNSQTAEDGGTFTNEEAI